MLDHYFSQIQAFAMNHVQFIPRDSSKEGNQQNQQNQPNQNVPNGDLTLSTFLTWEFALDIYTLDINILTLDIYTVNIWTLKKSASSFLHQAAALYQPAPARQPTNQLLTLLPCHTHIMAARSIVV